VAKMKLTAAAVARAKAPSSGQTDYFDMAYPGLALRVTAKGVKSWTYHARVRGKLKRATLGRYPDLTLAEARKQAGETAEMMHRGDDPTEAKRKARRAASQPIRDTVAAVAAEWLKRDQAGNRSKDEVRRIFDRDVLPLWGELGIKDIGRREVIELIDGIVDRGAPTMARRIHAHLHRMFRWAVGRAVIEANPMADLPKPGGEKPRDRVLSDTEVAEVWRATDALGYPFGPLIKLLVLTGARRDEIGSLTWQEIDFDEAAIRLEGGRTKNGVPHVIPLSPTSLDVINAIPKVELGEGEPGYVFTTTRRSAVSGWSRAKRQVDELVIDGRRRGAVGSGTDSECVEALAPWRLHDLRRTVATGLQRLGFRLEVIESVLGHVSGSRAGIVGVYQRHDFIDDKCAALAAWGLHVAECVVSK
jgi:integrase